MHALQQCSFTRQTTFPCKRCQSITSLYASFVVCVCPVSSYVHFWTLSFQLKQKLGYYCFINLHNMHDYPFDFNKALNKERILIPLWKNWRACPEFFWSLLSQIANLVMATFARFQMKSITVNSFGLIFEDARNLVFSSQIFNSIMRSQMFNR